MNYKQYTISAFLNTHRKCAARFHQDTFILLYKYVFTVEADSFDGVHELLVNWIGSKKIKKIKTKSKRPFIPADFPFQEVYFTFDSNRNRTVYKFYFCCCFFHWRKNQKRKKELVWESSLPHINTERNISFSIVSECLCA